MRKYGLDTASDLLACGADHSVVRGARCSELQLRSDDDFGDLVGGYRRGICILASSREAIAGCARGACQELVI